MTFDTSFLSQQVHPAEELFRQIEAEYLENFLIDYTLLQPSLLSAQFFLAGLVFFAHIFLL
ncbi:hypothetical protein D3C75_1064750 [compost metagenome]